MTLDEIRARCEAATPSFQYEWRPILVALLEIAEAASAQPILDDWIDCLAISTNQAEKKTAIEAARRLHAALAELEAL